MLAVAPFGSQAAAIGGNRLAAQEALEDLPAEFQDPNSPVRQVLKQVFGIEDMCVESLKILAQAMVAETIWPERASTAKYATPPLRTCPCLASCMQWDWLTRISGCLLAMLPVCRGYVKILFEHSI